MQKLNEISRLLVNGKWSTIKDEGNKSVSYLINHFTKSLFSLVLKAKSNF